MIYSGHLKTETQSPRQGFIKRLTLPDNKKRLTCHHLVFILMSALFFALFQNVAFWVKAFGIVPMNSVREVLLIISLSIVMFCAINIIFSLLLWKYISKPVLILFLLISASANYFAISYGVYVDKTMIANVAQTNGYETYALITPKLLVWLFIFGVLPSLFVWRIRLTYGTNRGKALALRTLSILLSVVIMLGVSLPLYKEYASFFRNNPGIVKLITPSNYIAGVAGFANQIKNKNKPLAHIAQDARKVPPVSVVGAKKTLLVVVLGETARAGSFSLNGYAKNTNPLLSKRTDLINFENVFSCGTATALSVPCMFSNMDRKNYSAGTAEYQENVLDVLAKADVNVFWRENNTGCQGVCKRIPTENMPKKNCPEGLCYDERLLDSGLDEYLSKQKEDMVVVLHTNGSHGPSYYQRYADEYKKFTPQCSTNQIQDCSLEALRNTYDNTIVYTDTIINQTIEYLKKYENQFDTAMLYISDHGESLGERGVYLHGTPYAIASEDQTRIPMIFWASKGFLERRNINPVCMRQKGKTETLSQDNLFHTLLGLMFIQTTEYKPEMDMFRSCQS